VKNSHLINLRAHNCFLFCIVCHFLFPEASEWSLAKPQCLSLYRMETTVSSNTNSLQDLKLCLLLTLALFSAILRELSLANRNYPIWARQGKYSCGLSCVAVANSLAYKCRQCKWSISLTFNAVSLKILSRSVNATLLCIRGMATNHSCREC
jgi:hypothetical protein